MISSTVRIILREELKSTGWLDISDACTLVDQKEAICTHNAYFLCKKEILESGSKKELIGVCSFTVTHVSLLREQHTWITELYCRKLGPHSLASFMDCGKILIAVSTFTKFAEQEVAVDEQNWQPPRLALLKAKDSGVWNWSLQTVNGWVSEEIRPSQSWYTAAFCSQKKCEPNWEKQTEGSQAESVDILMCHVWVDTYP